MKRTDSIAGMIITTLLCETILFSACSLSDKGAEKRDGRVISEDDPYYETEELVFDQEYVNNIGYGDGKYLSVVSKIEGKTDDHWLVHLTLYYGDGQTDILELFDKEGNRISSFNISELIEDHEAEIRDMGIFPTRCIIGEDTVTYYHINGCQIVLSKDLSTLIEFRLPESYDEEYMEYQGTISFEGLSIDKYLVSGQTNSTVLEIMREDGTVVTADLRKDFPHDIAEPYEVIPYHEGDAVYLLLVTKGSLYRVDPYSGATSRLSDDSYDYLTGYDLSGLSYIDGEVLITDIDGIKKVDIGSSKVSDYLVFDNCNINRGIVSTLEPYSVNDTTVVLITGNDGQIADAASRVITLTRCEENPNAGKHVLTAGGMITNDIYESIREFNETDDECFIIPDIRYRRDDYLTGSSSSGDLENMRTDYMNADKRLSDALAVDLMAGEGPDLFFGAAAYPQLQNSDMFIDMNEYLDKDIDDGLWDNIIEASSGADGKLYCVPLSFEFLAIVTDKTGYGNERNGLTFDEYSLFREEVLNGTNIVSYNRLGFISTVLPSVIRDVTDGDGIVDFGCDPFIALCEYSKNSITDTSLSSYYNRQGIEAEVRNIDSFGSFLHISSYMNIDPLQARLLALPSYDGTGIMLSPVTDSVSVSTCNPNIEGSMRFVNLLLSYDAQMRHGSRSAVFDDTGRNLVNVRAFEDSARMAMDSYNAECDYYLDMFGDEVRSAGVPYIRVDEQILDRYEDTISGISFCGSVDPAINIIVYEEIQAYLEDQKTLDDVIRIINNRAQLVMDERGWQ